MDAVIETAWTVPAIKTALDDSSLVREGEMTLRVLEGAEPVLLATMHEYGDLPIYLSVGGAQIVCLGPAVARVRTGRSPRASTSSC